VILLALTSNDSAPDFQFIENKQNDKYLFEEVLLKSKPWGTKDNMMYVVGATQAKKLKKIREYIPEHFLLIPGVGAQGGNLQDVARYGMNEHCGLIVNSARSIIYAGQAHDFAKVAGVKAREMQQEMQKLLQQKGIV